MRQLALDRQNRTSIRQKAKWALYEKKTFRRLIEDIAELITNLTELFPANQAIQQSLCEREVATIVPNKESRQVLREIAAEHDTTLLEAILKVASNVSGPHNIVFSGHYNKGFQLAHNSGTISGLNFGKSDP